MIATQQTFTKNVKALLANGKKTTKLNDVVGQDIREAFNAGKLDQWLNPILDKHDSEDNPVGHKNLLQLIRDNTDNKRSLRPIVKGSKKGYQVNDQPKTREVKTKIATLIKNNEKAIELTNKLELPEPLRAQLIAAYEGANEALKAEALAQAGVTPEIAEAA